MQVAKELPKYELDLIGLQEVIWYRSGIEPTRGIGNGEGNGNHELGTGLFLHDSITSSIKKAEFFIRSCTYY
jgi:hypothetical protein